MTWPVAMEAHGRMIICDRCGLASPILYREWGVFDLHRMFCAACMGELAVPREPNKETP